MTRAERLLDNYRRDREYAYRMLKRGDTSFWMTLVKQYSLLVLNAAYNTARPIFKIKPIQDFPLCEGGKSCDIYYPLKTKE